MAKRMKEPPVRKIQGGDDDSVLLRSAESLGRMIGALQRQLDRVSERLPIAASDAVPVRGTVNSGPAVKSTGSGAKRKSAKKKSAKTKTAASKQPRKKQRL